MNNLQFTDNAISHIAQLLQIAILTGTDIVDNLRAAQFTTKNNQIEVSPDYYETFTSNLERMLEEANETHDSSAEAAEDKS